MDSSHVQNRYAGAVYHQSVGMHMQSIAGPNIGPIFDARSSDIDRCTMPVSCGSGTYETVEG
eukprot:5179694-Amphidinium_carterae.1